MNLEEAAFSEIFKSAYDERMQISPYQAQIIASSILTKSPGCRLLIFGVGYDSQLWKTLNKDGETHFVESSLEWMSEALQKDPQLSISLLQPSNLTVANSGELSIRDLQTYPPPKELTNTNWDVILVDGPSGYSADDPGRARTIYWASRLASSHTHVFVDDYDRPLERRFAEMLFRTRGSQSVILPASDHLPYRKMFWSVGSTIARNNRLPVVLSVATSDYAQKWRFCIDSQYSYARRHGFEYRCIDPSSSPLNPKWAKLEAALNILEQGRDVLLIDADAEITKSCPPFTQLIQANSESDIFFARGISSRPNSGVLVLRGGPNSAATALLAECLERRQDKVPIEDFVTEEGENGHVIWLLKNDCYSRRSIAIIADWNCTDPNRAQFAYVRHYTNHLGEWLKSNPKD